MEKENRLKRMRKAATANLVIAVGSALLFPFSGSKVLSGEAAHSGSDAAMHGLRYFAEKRGVDQESSRFRLFIKGSLLVPAGFLAWNAWRSGLDILNNVQLDQSRSASVANGVGAVAIAALNGYAYYQTSGIEEHSHASHASHNHAFADALVSGGFVASLGAEAVGVEQASTVGSCIFSSIAAAHLLKEALTLSGHHNHD